MNSKAGLAAAVLAFGVITYLYLEERQRAATLRMELAQSRSNEEALGTELEELRKTRIDAAELEKLRADQREAIRLRGELTNLRGQVSNAVASAKSAENVARAAEGRAEKARAATAAVEGLRTPVVFNSKAGAVLPPGQSLVVGGWPTKPGTLTYAFLSPTVAEQGGDTVMVSGKLIELPQALATQLQTMRSNPGGGLTLTPEQMNEMLASWEQQPGVNVLASPRMIVQSGQKGTASVGSMRPTPNGQMHFGPEIEVTPTLFADGANIQLEVNAKLTVDPSEGQ